MTEPESQPAITRQIAAECDHVKMENAELRSTVSGLSGLVNEWMARAGATHERLECRVAEIAAHERTEAELRNQLSEAIGERAKWRAKAEDCLRTWVKCDDARQEELQRNENLRDEARQFRASIAANWITINSLRETVANLREQVKQYKESLRLIQQMRRADG